MEQKQYTLVKLPLKEIVKHNFKVTMDKETEIKSGYLVAQGDSLLFDQIERLRGSAVTHMNEVILWVSIDMTFVSFYVGTAGSPRPLAA